MSSRLNCFWRLFVCCTIVMWSGMYLLADIPHYHGKVVLVVDRSLLADSEFINRLYRLEDDLVGDGWRVLRHEVDRGVETGSANWSTLNAPRVREVRALIKADYDADPQNVKAVFLLGHVPIPYAGDTAAISGGHQEIMCGAHPADCFYGDMTTLYGSAGWSDCLVSARANVRPQNANAKYDGKFDQTFLPSTLKLGVGRVDLYHMPSYDPSDLPLIKRYLDKNHDFRQGNFGVQRRALLCKWDDPRFNYDVPSFTAVFGNGSVKEYTSCSFHWFPYASGDNDYPDTDGDGQDFLVGLGLGYGNDCECYGVGISNHRDGYRDTFLEYDSQVVFASFCGSYFGSWDYVDNFLRAPLANLYGPGHRGYGLTTAFSTADLGAPTLADRAAGAWVGKAWLQDPPLASAMTVNYGLLGDPTLRWHVVHPPTALTGEWFGDMSVVRLTWTPSPDATRYNVYRAPTRKGPFVLVNAEGPVSGTTYDVVVPDYCDPQYNFLMVRALKTEVIPNGTSYENMSEGAVTNVPGLIGPYLAITCGPANQKAVADTLDGTANSVALSVDALGIDTSGNEVLAYQWFKNGEELTDGPQIDGATSRALLIKAVEPTDGDGDNYKVRVSISGLSPQTTAEAVVLVGPAFPVADCLVTIDEGSSIELDASDYVNSANPGADLQLMGLGVPALAYDNPNHGIANYGFPSKGSVEIVGATTIRYTSKAGFYGTDTFYYRVTDGYGSVLGKVAVTVRDMSLAHNLARYGLTGRALGAYGSRQTTGGSRDLANGDWEIIAKQCAGPACGYLESMKIIGDFEIAANVAQFEGISGANVLAPSGQGALGGLILREVATSATDLALSSCAVTAGSFSFNISGPPGINCIVETCQDLTGWSTAGTVTLDSGGTATFSYSASSPYRFFRVYGSGNVHAPHVVGYMRLTLSYTNSFIANQLDTPDNRISALLTTLPDGTQCRRWNGSGWDTATFSSGLWDHPDWTLNPGEGRFIDLPGATLPQELTFAGTVKDGYLIKSIPPGESVVSSRLPCAGTMFDSNTPLIGQMPLPNGLVYTWNGFGWDVSAGSTAAFTPPVTLTVGQPIKVLNSTTNARSWSQTYNPWITSRDLYDRFVAIGVGPANGYYAFKYAAQTTTPVFSTAGDVPVTALPNAVVFPNAWVKIRRDASLVSIYVSADGSSWEKVNTFALWNLASEVEVGYYVTGTANKDLWRAVFRPIKLLNCSEGSGNIDFQLTGPASIPCQVESSSDLIQWSPIHTATLDTTGHGSCSCSSVDPYQFFRANYGSLRSANAVGYAHQSLSNDWTLISNPLNAPDNRVSAVLSGLPDESKALKWDADHTTWMTNTFTGSQWEFPEWTLYPGEGAMIDLPAGCLLPWDITFVGEVMQGNLQISLPTRTILCSSMVPQAGPVDVLGLSLTRNDTLSKWLGTSYQTFTMRSWGWSPSTPAAAVGESIFVTKLEEPGTWSRSFNILQSLHLCSPSEQAGTFSFILKGPAGIDCTIEMSTDLVNWSSAGTVTLNAPDGTGDFSCASISPYQFFRASYGTLKSANAVGYVRSTLSTDWTLIANPLNAPDNRISAVLSGLPEGSKAMQWAPGGWQTATLTSGQWDYPDWTLNPGEGAMIDLPEGCSLPLDITFVGEVMQGDLQVDLPVGTSLCSSMVPQAGTVEALGLICTRTERVTKWDGTAYMLFSKTLTAWNPYTPSLVVGESAFVEKKAAEPWNRSFSVWP